MNKWETELYLGCLIFLSPTISSFPSLKAFTVSFLLSSLQPTYLYLPPCLQLSFLPSPGSLYLWWGTPWIPFPTLFPLSSLLTATISSPLPASLCPSNFLVSQPTYLLSVPIFTQFILSFITQLSPQWRFKAAYIILLSSILYSEKLCEVG